MNLQWLLISFSKLFFSCLLGVYVLSKAILVSYISECAFNSFSILHIVTHFIWASSLVSLPVFMRVVFLHTLEETEVQNAVFSLWQHMTLWKYMMPYILFLLKFSNVFYYYNYSYFSNVEAVRKYKCIRI